MTSIRRHLTRRLLIGASLIGLTTFVAIFLHLRDEWYEQFDSSLVSRARTLGSLVRIDDDDQHLEFELTEPSAREFRIGPRPDYFQIWDHNGALVARSASLQGMDLADDPGTGGIRHRKRFHNLTLPDGRAGRAVTLVIEPGLEDAQYGERPAQSNTPSGRRVTLVLASDLAEMSETLWHVFLMLLIAFIASAAAMVIVIRQVVRSSLRPLLDIGDAAARVAPETLSTRFDVDDSPEELRPVIDKLNDLLDRLDSAFKRERRFTSNVAHELRTPIAELRSLAEVAIRWPGETRDAAGGNFHDVLQIARQMQSVVAALLSMARCQAGHEGLVFAPIELADVVSDAWRPHESAARFRELKVDFDIALPAVVDSDRTILPAVLDNLFANAVAYATQGGTIQCRGRASGDAYIVEIMNSNEVLTENDLPLLTEPFWRKDAARTDLSSSGLGLALVAAYTKLLHIRFGTELPSPNLFVVSLRIPLAAMETGTLPKFPIATNDANRDPALSP